MTLIARGRTYLGVLSVSRPVKLLFDVLLGTMWRRLEAMLFALLGERPRQRQPLLLLELPGDAGCILAASINREMSRAQCMDWAVWSVSEEVQS
jgi:hypothetical protein